MTTPSAGGVQDAAGFVLAGGRSRRMGTDKALVNFAGQPLIACALGILRAAGLNPRIAGAHSDLAVFAPVVPDFDPGLGPLSGICAALQSSPSPYAVFLPVDMPLLPASLIVYMLNHVRITEHLVTLYSVNGYPQTFPALLRRECLPLFEREVAAGRRGCFSAFQAAASGLMPAGPGNSMSILPVEVLAQAGLICSAIGLAPVRWFHNLNSPADLGRALSRLA